MNEIQKIFSLILNEKRASLEEKLNNLSSIETKYTLKQNYELQLKSIQNKVLDDIINNKSYSNEEFYELITEFLEVINESFNEFLTPEDRYKYEKIMELNTRRELYTEVLIKIKELDKEKYATVDQMVRATDS